MSYDFARETAKLCLFIAHIWPNAIPWLGDAKRRGKQSQCSIFAKSFRQVWAPKVKTFVDSGVCGCNISVTLPVFHSVLPWKVLRNEESLRQANCSYTDNLLVFDRDGSQRSKHSGGRGCEWHL